MRTARILYTVCIAGPPPMLTSVTTHIGNAALIHGTEQGKVCNYTYLATSTSVAGPAPGAIIRSGSTQKSLSSRTNNGRSWTSSGSAHNQSDHRNTSIQRSCVTIDTGGNHTNGSSKWYRVSAPSSQQYWS